MGDETKFAPSQQEWFCLARLVDNNVQSYSGDSNLRTAVVPPVHRPGFASSQQT